MDVRGYLRSDMMPHMLCPGCGHGIVLQALLRAIDRQQIDPDTVAVVAGIGCSSRLAGYVDFCTLHATHGRAPAFATGLKLARPDLTVIVITGDGDGLAIGGNHLIHAARRNIGLVCLLFNNAIYGMTGGQVAPTTPLGGLATTAPFGNPEPSFDACRLMVAAGATFVARGLSYEPTTLATLCEDALRHEGFAFIEVVSDCPEYYGRYNRLGRGPEMLQAQKRRTATVAPLLARKAALGAGTPTVDTGLATGVLHRAQRPEYAQVCRQLAEGKVR
jgi:2-oxoglutarate ferredoxin oxidoreductase subunit beta